VSQPRPRGRATSCLGPGAASTCPPATSEDITAVTKSCRAKQHQVQGNSELLPEKSRPGAPHRPVSMTSCT